MGLAARDPLVPLLGPALVVDQQLIALQLCDRRDVPRLRELLDLRSTVIVMVSPAAWRRRIERTQLRRSSDRRVEAQGPRLAGLARRGLGGRRAARTSTSCPRTKEAAAPGMASATDGAGESDMSGGVPARERSGLRPRSGVPVPRSDARGCDGWRGMRAAAAFGRLRCGFCAPTPCALATLMATYNDGRSIDPLTRTSQFGPRIYCSAPQCNLQGNDRRNW